MTRKTKSITEAELGRLMADYLDVLQKLYNAHQSADLVYGFKEWTTRASLNLGRADYADVRRGIAKGRKFLRSIEKSVARSTHCVRSGPRTRMGRVLGR